MSCTSCRSAQYILRFYDFNMSLSYSVSNRLNFHVIATIQLLILCSISNKSRYRSWRTQACNAVADGFLALPHLYMGSTGLQVISIFDIWGLTRTRRSLLSNKRWLFCVFLLGIRDTLLLLLLLGVSNNNSQNDLSCSIVKIYDEELLHARGSFAKCRPRPIMKKS